MQQLYRARVSPQHPVHNDRGHRGAICSRPRTVGVKGGQIQAGVDNRDPGDHGYSWVATEDYCLISGVTTWVAKGSSCSHTGKIGRCQLDGTEHILGICGILYLFVKTTAEVAIGDDFANRRIVVRRVLHSIARQRSRSNWWQTGPGPQIPATAQAWLVKYSRSIINDPYKDAYAAESPNTR